MTTAKKQKLSTQDEIIAPENRVAEYREKRHLTGKRLAELSGIDPTILSRIERRTRHISGEELLSLARALKAPTFDLLPVGNGAAMVEFYDETRMIGATMAVLEAYEKLRMKSDPQDVADLISFLYTRSVTKRLSVKDVRAVADQHVKAIRNGSKTDSE